MGKRFFIYDNGKSIFNIDQIVRIYVQNDEERLGKNRYKVVVVGLLVYDITKEEYNRLMDFIKEMDE